MSRSVVVLCMGGAGHVQVLLPVVQGLHERGCDVRVMTRADFRATVERAGARFVDLYAERPLEAADATSIPVPSRFVSFAAAYAPMLAREVAAWTPDLIVYDTYTVVAPVIARMLDVPYVNVCPNHAPVPSRVIAVLRDDPRVVISSACWAAVERLAREHGMRDASPFSYVEALSPFLNLYCEPPEFLPEDDRATFAPLEFFGSLPLHPREARPARVIASRRRPRVYVSFGTGVFRYYEDAAQAAFTVISRTLAELDLEVVLSLGGHALDRAARFALRQPGVWVEDHVDQWALLAEVDLFVTHHGLNSTHEAIFHGVPMLSYPFFGDQPALARRCQDLGLAVSFAHPPRAPIEPDVLRAALVRTTDDRAALATRLAEARSWELRTMAKRAQVLDRILALAGTGG